MKRSLKKMFGMIVVCAMFATALGVTAVSNYTSSDDQVISLGDPRDPYAGTAVTTGDPREPYSIIGQVALGDPRDPYNGNQV